MKALCVKESLYMYWNMIVLLISVNIIYEAAITAFEGKQSQKRPASIYYWLSLNFSKYMKFSKLVFLIFLSIY